MTLANSFLLLPRGARVAAAVLVVGLVPLVFLGPGTDLDVGAVIASGRLIVAGHYRASRPPGAPVHELIVGVLDRVGGIWLSNTATLVAAIAVVALVVALARDHGVGRPWLAGAVVATNPWFLVAATSTVDFPFALSGVLGGALALRRDRRIVAGALFGLAIGCRVTSALGIAAALVADLAGGRQHTRRVVMVGIAAAIVGAACFVPAFVSAGGSLAFAQNDFSTASFGTMLGRALAKDFYFIGPFAVIVLLVAVPRLVRGAWRQRDNWLVRFGFLLVVFEEALFIRFPWKMGHLLPLLVGLALLLGAAFARYPKIVVVFAAAQLVYGFVNLQLVEPDNPNRATGARAVFDIRWGVVVTDVACRGDDTEAWQGNDKMRLEAVWNCAKPFGDGP